MSRFIFTREDRAEFRRRGVREEEVLEQLETFKNPPPPIQLDRPCTPGDGIRTLGEAERQALIDYHEEAARSGRCMKFVPASGAATRMFKRLLRFLAEAESLDGVQVARKAEAGDEDCRELISFMKALPSFAFYGELRTIMREAGEDMEVLRAQGRFQEIIRYLLEPKGLDYAQTPKGLLQFHRYDGECRTAFEEHLVEAAAYIRDAKGRCRLHFTVSPEHRRRFEMLLEEVQSDYERKLDVRYEVTFSVQEPSTDTIAVDLQNQPFRLVDGRLHFRPGGHGALIKNLNGLRGDIVFIKNIDNVVPDHLKDTAHIWKKSLSGLLLRIQRRIFSLLEELVRSAEDEDLLREASDFASTELSLTMPDRFRDGSPGERRAFLFAKLNRPLRVCGVVKNVGEPGGGPFWVRDPRGGLSPQIVERAQVDYGSAEQDAVWQSATHFNPVDIVCALRDFQGKAFDLREYVDPDAAILTRKSAEGRDLKALELPGLWNGGMAHWNTIFVEVPIATFNPVKTVMDLLREAHQPP